MHDDDNMFRYLNDSDEHSADYTTPHETTVDFNMHGDVA
jgi:hypothetical protein